MKCEDEVRPANPRQGPMRARLALELPTKFDKCSNNTFGLGRRPLTHAAAGSEKLISIGPASPCSMRSASTRSASTSALAMASSAELPVRERSRQFENFGQPPPVVFAFAFKSEIHAAASVDSADFIFRCLVTPNV